MRRTARLQGLRLMKSEDIYARCYRGDLSQVEASKILGVSGRSGAAKGVARRLAASDGGDDRAFRIGRAAAPAANA